MKIAILSYGHFSSIMPLAKQIAKEHDLVLYLMVQGEKFSESVCSLDLANIPNGELNLEVSKELLDENILDYLGENVKIKIVKYPNLKLSNYLNYLISIKFAKELNIQKFDIIHFNGIKFFQFIINFFTRKGKSIWTIHDPFLHSGEQNSSAIKMYKFLSFYNLNVILHNQFYLQGFKKQFNFNQEKVHYLPYGPLEIFQQYKKHEVIEEPNTIIFFGRISKYKGLKYLIEAVNLIREKVPNLKLIIAGTGKTEINFEELKWDELFEIHNYFVANEELVELIQRSSIVICPYTDATQSGVVMTSFALYKPVIATAVGGISEVVINNETGMLISPKDSITLANTINDLLINTEKITFYKKRINDIYFKGDYSWKVIGQKLIDIYQSIK